MTARHDTKRQERERRTGLARGLAAIALATLALGACGTEMPQALQIVGNVVPSDECLVKTQGGGQQEIRPNGVMDLAVGSAYYGYFMITNEFPQFEGITGFQPDDARLDGATISLGGLRVTLELPAEVVGNGINALNAEAQALGWTSSPFTNSGAVATLSYERAAGGTFGPGEAGVAITDVVPRNVGRMLRVLDIFKDATGGVASNEVEATLKIIAFGKRADGKKVSSAPYVYPITICYRCLMLDSYPRSAALRPFDAANGIGVLTVDAITNNACVLGSDVPITNAVCGALYGPDASVNDQCKLDRCFGDDDSTGQMGDTIKCDNDGTTADIKVAE